MYTHTLASEGAVVVELALKTHSLQARVSLLRISRLRFSLRVIVLASRSYRRGLATISTVVEALSFPAKHFTLPMP